MRTITRTLYTFDELSDAQKAVAIGHNREFNLIPRWWVYVYDDAKEVAALMGLEIHEIYFQGFWNQGDGACFNGTILPKKGIVAAVKACAPKDFELHAIAAKMVELQRFTMFTACATIRQSGRYYHERSMAVDVDYDRGRVNESHWLVWCADFAKWIYDRLEAEYEHLTSDEAVAKSLRANEVEFEIDKDGCLV